MNEADFFANLATRLGRPTPTGVLPRNVMGAPVVWKQSRQPDEGIIGKFQAELDNLGGQVMVLDSLESMHAHLSEILQNLNPSSVGVWGSGFTTSFNLNETISPYSVVEWSEYGVQEFQHVDVSITGCAYAIADTGTIVMMNGGPRGRSAAVLPAVHIVLLREGQIRHRMGEVFEDIIASSRGHLPASIHFISGPSRSSDIENDQTIGIHGPAVLMVMILRG